MLECMSSLPQSALCGHILNHHRWLNQECMFLRMCLFCDSVMCIWIHILLLCNREVFEPTQQTFYTSLFYNLTHTPTHTHILLVSPVLDRVQCGC